jgi:hypothetical protein
MRRAYLPFVALTLLALLASGCAHRCGCGGSRLGVVLGYALMTDYQDRNDNPEREWLTSDGSPPGDPDLSVTPAPPVALASVARPGERRFDLGGAYAALSRVDLTDCREDGLARGYGRALVAFADDGSAIGVGLELPVGSAPDARACVEDAFRRASVAPFDGDTVNVRRAFYVP